jgi:hypothetical protein
MESSVGTDGGEGDEPRPGAGEAASAPHVRTVGQGRLPGACRSFSVPAVGGVRGRFGRGRQAEQAGGDQPGETGAGASARLQPTVAAAGQPATLMRPGVTIAFAVSLGSATARPFTVPIRLAGAPSRSQRRLPVRRRDLPRASVPS